MCQMHMQSDAHAVLSESLKMEAAFPDLLLFVQIVLTVPIASASAERSFSTMKCMKTYLQSTMTDQRLNNLCLLAVEREMSHDLLSDASSVVDKFALLHDRRLSFVSLMYCRVLKQYNMMTFLDKYLSWIGLILFLSTNNIKI